VVAIIELSNGYWIERTEHNFSAVATGATVNVDVIFSRAGQPVGISYVSSQTNGDIAKPFKVIFMENGTTGILNASDFTAPTQWRGIRCRFTNLDAVLTNGAFIVTNVILRRPNR